LELTIAGIRAAPLAKGTERLYYPGEIAILNDARNRRDSFAPAQDKAAEIDALRAA
jgi:hypothetical protein